MPVAPLFMVRFSKLNLQCPETREQALQYNLRILMLRICQIQAQTSDKNNTGVTGDLLKKCRRLGFKRLWVKPGIPAEFHWRFTHDVLKLMCSSFDSIDCQVDGHIDRQTIPNIRIFSAFCFFAVNNQRSAVN